MVYIYYVILGLLESNCCLLGVLHIMHKTCLQNVSNTEDGFYKSILLRKLQYFGEYSPGGHDITEMTPGIW